MNHHFQWDRERIRFFCDAAQNSAFHRTLAALLAAEIEQNDRVLDAGCGLGYLSEALLPYCKTVTAVDCDPLAIEALQERTHGNTCLRAICADVHTLQTTFDVVVCCYFGSTQEALRLLKRTHAHKLLLIKRKLPAHRFRTDLPEHERTALAASRILDESGCSYQSFDASITFDQPFRSLSDAARFFSLYRGEAVSEEAARHLCEETGDAVFPYRLPVTNDMRIFTVLS